MLPPFPISSCGILDQEDPWVRGKFSVTLEHDPDHTNFIVAGPWFHGEWQNSQGRTPSVLFLAGHETAREFAKILRLPSSATICMAGRKPPGKQHLSTGSNTWHTYSLGSQGS